ncbi:MAG TPA: hypothetical protein VMO17_09950 [Terriglobia bacterium]|nr:hypothetical protein [Terriglobia bacterium]
MAIVRTVLPRKGFVQPQHGITQYESDMDANMSLLDANVAFLSDLASVVDALVGDLGLNGVVSGFQLATSNSLYPSVTSGILYANGVRYAPTSAALNPAPANATSYLFFQQENWPSSYYYRSVLSSLNAGDAFLGVVVTNGTQVTSVTQASALFGQIPVAATGPGPFTVPHLLGRVPVSATIRMTSPGAIWWQSPTDMDGVNLYLVASDAGVTAKVQVC